MENLDLKNSEVVVAKAPLPVVIISLFLLLTGLLTIISLFVGGISGLFVLSSFNGPLISVVLVVFGLASLFLSFRIRKMQKSGLYGTMALIVVSLLPTIFLLTKINPQYLMQVIATPQIIIKIGILIYLFIIRKKFS